MCYDRKNQTKSQTNYGDSEMSISKVVKKHLEAAIAEAGEQGHPPENVARSMLSFVIAIYRENRDVADIIEELQYSINNLDPDQEYEFMRP